MRRWLVRAGAALILIILAGRLHDGETRLGELFDFWILAATAVIEIGVGLWLWDGIRLYRAEEMTDAIERGEGLTVAQRRAILYAASRKAASLRR